MTKLRARLLVALVLLWVMGAAVALPGAAFAQGQQYHMDRYDSDITVNADGSMDIVETLVYVYTSGSFHRGLRTWDLDRVEGLTVSGVSEERNGETIQYTRGLFDPDKSITGKPGTFGVENGSSQLRLRWIYDPTSNDSRTFKVAYHVEGAIRVYANLDRFDWYAVPPRWGAPINASRVSVTFPDGTDTSGWDVASVPKRAEISKQGNTIIWTANSGIDDGFEVGADVPKGVLSVTKPSWQDQFDRLHPDQAGNTGNNSGTPNATSIPSATTTPTKSGSSGSSSGGTPNSTRSLIDLGIFVFSVILLVGGILWRLTKWYSLGRDKVVKLPIDYLAQPPSDLPPGLVGALLDETADIRDLIATIADLGRKGNLTITETRNGALHDYVYTQTGGKTDYKYEEMVLQTLFNGRQTVNLSALKNDFQKGQVPIYAEMYKNLVALKYFPESPDAVRERASKGCGWTLLVGALVFGAGLFFGAQLSYMLIILGVVLAILAVVRIFTSSAMPRKTDFGAEETARWFAFKRYLQQIQSYTNVQAAADKFQQYLPYAVAMGIDKEFTRQFNSVPAAMPGWYAPYGFEPLIFNVLASGIGPSGSSMGGAGATNLGGGGGGGNFDPGGAMQGMSDSLGGAMQGLSDSFTGMVNSASSVFTGGSIPSVLSAGISTGGSGGSGNSGSDVAGSLASSVGGALFSVAISAIFGGGGGGGGGGGAD